MSIANKGDRIELVTTTDPYTALQPGARGVVIDVDDWGTVHVRWDEGSTLGLIPGEDSYKIIEAHDCWQHASYRESARAGDAKRWWECARCGEPLQVS